MTEQSSQQTFMDDEIRDDIDLELIIYPKLFEVDSNDRFYVVKHLSSYLIKNKFFISKKKFISLSIILSKFDIQPWLINYYLNILVDNDLSSISETINKPDEISSHMKNYMDNHFEDDKCISIIEDSLLCSIECITIGGIMQCIKSVINYKIDYIGQCIESLKTICDLFDKYQNNYYNDIIINIY